MRWAGRVTGGVPFASVSTRGTHTCGVRAFDGAAMGWGDNTAGKRGYGPGNDPRPARAP